MKDWKQQLYQSYVSTGQASGSGPIGVGDEGRLLFYRSIIRQHLNARKTAKIVDLACGSGLLLYALRQEGYENVVGVDVSHEQVELAHRRGIENVQLCDMGSFLSRSDLRLDFVFMIDVLEHLEPAEMLSALALVHAAMAPDGVLIIHVPNAEGIFGMRMRYGDMTHVTAFTKQSISQALLACGFAAPECHEDKPLVHGWKSFIRRVLWDALSGFPKLLLIAETGERLHILSQNMLVVARLRDAASK